MPTPYLPREGEFSGKGDRKHGVVHKGFITTPQTRGCTDPKLCFILSSPHFTRSQTVLHIAHWMDGQERQRWRRKEVPRIISQQPDIKNWSNYKFPVLQVFSSPLCSFLFNLPLKFLFSFNMSQCFPQIASWFYLLSLIKRHIIGSNFKSHILFYFHVSLSMVLF